MMLFIVTLLFALVRLSIGTTPNVDLHSLPVECYKDAAHIYVGILTGVYLGTRKKEYLTHAIFLTVVEVLVAVLSRVL
jgi:hypothetical protein